MLHVTVSTARLGDEYFEGKVTNLDNAFGAAQLVEILGLFTQDEAMGVSLAIGELDKEVGEPSVVEEPVESVLAW